MLRPATTDDIFVIRDLAHAIWWAHYPDIISPEQITYMLNLMYSPDALHRQMTEEGVQFWLVKPDTMPVGFIAVGSKGSGSYFIHKFYLQKTEQRKGLGSTTFHAMLEQYPDLQELRLTVNRLNFKSINFYFKIGFRIESCIDVPIGNDFIMNDFVMLWRR
ncbi:MAG: GNAT family N-acetyltransferase [Saprospiraceae bacterium]|nr:GNAT family N-acetyltransferase [Saprospiraceae bacterium]